MIPPALAALGPDDSVWTAEDWRQLFEDNTGAKPRAWIYGARHGVIPDTPRNRTLTDAAHMCKEHIPWTTEGMSAVHIDIDNPAPEFWAEVGRAAADGHPLARRLLLIRSYVSQCDFLAIADADDIFRWCKTLPGWMCGPPWAPHPLLCPGP